MGKTGHSPAVLASLLFVLIAGFQVAWILVDQSPPRGDAALWHHPIVRSDLGLVEYQGAADYYPPLVHWIAAAGCRMAGEYSPTVARLSVYLCFVPLLAWSAWRLGGWIALGFTLAAPEILVYSRELFLEVPLAAALLWLAAELREEEPRPLPLSGSVLTGLLIKFSFPLYALPAVFLAAWRWRRTPVRTWTMLKGLLLGALLAFPWYQHPVSYALLVRPQLHEAVGWVRVEQVARAVAILETGILWNPPPSWHWSASLSEAHHHVARGRVHQNAYGVGWLQIGTWLVILPAALSALSGQARPLLTHALGATLLLSLMKHQDPRYLVPLLPLLTCAVGAASSQVRGVLAGGLLLAVSFVGACGWVEWSDQPSRRAPWRVAGVVTEYVNLDADQPPSESPLGNRWVLPWGGAGEWPLRGLLPRRIPVASTLPIPEGLGGGPPDSGSSQQDSPARQGNRQDP